MCDRGNENGGLSFWQKEQHYHRAKKMKEKEEAKGTRVRDRRDVYRHAFCRTEGVIALGKYVQMA